MLLTHEPDQSVLKDVPHICIQYIHAYMYNYIYIYIIYMYIGFVCVHQNQNVRIIATISYPRLSPPLIAKCLKKNKKCGDYQQTYPSHQDCLCLLRTR